MSIMNYAKNLVKKCISIIKIALANAQHIIVTIKPVIIMFARMHAIKVLTY